MLLVILLTALVAGFVQSVTGFGGAVVMMMTLPHFFPMKISTALAGLLTIPMCLELVWMYRQKIHPRKVLFPALIYLLSSGFFIRLAAGIDLEGLKAAFGLLLMALAAYFNFFSQRIHIRANVPTALVCGGFSGLTGGLFGIGGPLMVLYYLSTTKDKEEYLGTINLLFTITESYSALLRYQHGFFSSVQGNLILCGVVAILIGRCFGSRVVDRLDGEKLKKLVYLLLALSGLITFLRA